jgi:predicted DNA-binding transcriptional regulator AlpA
MWSPCVRNGVQVIAMSNSEPILSKFLTKEELAAELQLNPRTLDRWDVLGMGPPRTHIGCRKVRYSRASVERWLAAQEHRRTVQ